MAHLVTDDGPVAGIRRRRPDQGRRAVPGLGTQVARRTRIAGRPHLRRGVRRTPGPVVRPVVRPHLQPVGRAVGQTVHVERALVGRVAARVRTVRHAGPVRRPARAAVRAHPVLVPDNRRAAVVRRSVPAQRHPPVARRRAHPARRIRRRDGGVVHRPVHEVGRPVPRDVPDGVRPRGVAHRHRVAVVHRRRQGQGHRRTRRGHRAHTPRAPGHPHDEIPRRRHRRGVQRLVVGQHQRRTVDGGRLQLRRNGLGQLVHHRLVGEARRLVARRVHQLVGAAGRRLGVGHLHVGVRGDHRRSRGQRERHHLARDRRGRAAQRLRRLRTPGRRLLHRERAVRQTRRRRQILAEDKHQVRVGRVRRHQARRRRIHRVVRQRRLRTVAKARIDLLGRVRVLELDGAAVQIHAVGRPREAVMVLVARRHRVGEHQLRRIRAARIRGVARRAAQVESEPRRARHRHHAVERHRDADVLPGIVDRPGRRHGRHRHPGHAQSGIVVEDGDRRRAGSTLWCNGDCRAYARGRVQNSQ